MPKRGRIIEIKPASPEVAAEVIAERRNAKDRDQCTVCKRAQEWFRLEPGTGRCVLCQP